VRFARFDGYVCSGFRVAGTGWFGEQCGNQQIRYIGSFERGTIHGCASNQYGGSLFLLNQLVKAKRLRKGASVVFTSSIAALQQATYAYSMYTTSKAGLQGFVKIAALELAGKRIRVNSVNPAMIETEMVGKSGLLTNEQYEADKQRYPLKRYGKPEEVAHAIIFLLSDGSSWVTGSALVIDGGIGLR